MRALVRLVTTLLALAAAVAGALLVVEVVWALLRPGTAGLLIPWADVRAELDRTSWNEMPVPVVAGLVGLAGLILVLLTIRAGRKEIRLHDPSPSVKVTTDRRSLARLVGHRVRELGDVASASVVAGRGRVRVRATSVFSEVGDLREQVSQTARESVRELPLRDPVEVSVKVSPAKERR